jgi:stage V sporulation protein S
MSAEEFLIKVADGSPVPAVAGSIAHAVRDGNIPVLRVIGAAAVNQGIKAVAVARSYLQEDGLDVACFPSFVELVVDGEERTALRIEIRKLEPEPDALAQF